MLWGVFSAILSLVILVGGGSHFRHFYLFFEKGWVRFHEFCKDVHSITLAIAQKILWHVAFVLEGYFKVF